MTSNRIMMLALAVVCCVSMGVQANLVAHYSFDDPSNLGADDSGNGNYLNADYANPATAVVGKVGAYAADFDGTAGYDRKVGETSPRIYPVGSFTVATWAKSDTSGSLTALTMPASLNGGFSLYTDGGVWRAGVYDGGADTINSGVATVVGEWAHIAFTFESESATGGVHTGTGTIYVDGIAKNSATMTYVGDAGGFRFSLGNRAVGRYMFDGSIDDFRIYDNALSAGEVGALVPEPATLSMVLGMLVFSRIKRKK